MFTSIYPEIDQQPEHPANIVNAKVSLFFPLSNFQEVERRSFYGKGHKHHAGKTTGKRK